MDIKNTFCQYVEDTYKWEVEIVQSTESSTEFIPEKKLWMAQFYKQIVPRSRKNYTFSRSNVVNCFYIIYYL